MASPGQAFTDASAVRAALIEKEEHIEQAARALKSMSHPLRLKPDANV